MSTPNHVVIVGGGLAGAKTAEALRAQGFAGDVTMLAAEPHLPCERPPLSKGYLTGEAPFDRTVVHPENWYRDNWSSSAAAGSAWKSPRPPAAPAHT